MFPLLKHPFLKGFPTALCDYWRMSRKIVMQGGTKQKGRDRTNEDVLRSNSSANEDPEWE